MPVSCVLVTGQRRTYSLFNAEVTVVARGQPLTNSQSSDRGMWCEQDQQPELDWKPDPEHTSVYRDSAGAPGPGQCPPS